MLHLFVTNDHHLLRSIACHSRTERYYCWFFVSLISPIALFFLLFRSDLLILYCWIKDFSTQIVPSLLFQFNKFDQSILISNSTSMSIIWTAMNDVMWCSCSYWCQCTWLLSSNHEWLRVYFYASEFFNKLWVWLSVIAVQ